MSCKVMYTCDHCGKEVSPYIGKQWKAGFLTVGPNIDDIHACSKEHLTLALAKTFDIPLDASTLRLVTEKNEALETARAVIIERDTMHARLAEFEARMPANEVTNAERAQYEATIEMQRKRIEELTSPVAIADNNTSPSLDDLAGKLVPVFEAAYHAGPNDQLASVRAGIRAVLAALPMPITQPVTIDGKTPGQVANEGYERAAGSRTESWEAAANAVLRAFGQPRQTTQDAAEALRRVRDRVSNEIHYEHKCLILDIVDDELAKLEAKPAGKAPECFLCGKGPHDHTISLPEQFEVKWCNGRRQNFGTEKPAWWDVPKSDHVHELGSCSFCDKSPPDTSTESGLPDAVHTAITLPTKPTKPLRERLEELASYWEKGAASGSMSEGYRQASKDCAKELREVINDSR